MSYNDYDLQPGAPRGRSPWRGPGGFTPRGRGRGGFNSSDGNQFGSPFGAPRGGSGYGSPRGSPMGLPPPFRGTPYGRGMNPQRGTPYRGGSGGETSWRGSNTPNPQYSGYRGNNERRGWSEPRTNRGGRGRGNTSEKIPVKDYVIPKMTSNPWEKLENDYRRELEREENLKTDQ